MLGTLTVKPLLWACGILFAAVLALSGVIVVKDARHDAAITAKATEISDLQRELSAADGQVVVLAAANAKQTKTVESLVGKLEMAVQETADLDRLLRGSEAETRDALNARDKALALLTSQRDKDYASDPSCSAWGTTPVCGRITGSVLDEWNAAAARRR